MHKLEAYLYIDTGNGFNKNEVLSCQVRGGEERLEFYLETVDRIRSLRLHPLNDYLILQIKQIEIFRPDKSRYCPDVFSTNAAYQENDRFIFSTSNPQISINIINNRVDRILFSLRYEAIGKEAFNHIFKCASKTIKEYDRQIHTYLEENDDLKKKLLKQGIEIQKNDKKVYQLQQEVHQLQQELDVLKQKLDAETLSRADLFNSKSWKLTAPIRATTMHARVLTHALRTVYYYINRWLILIQDSGLFDIKYYFERYPDVKDASLNPITHYLWKGAKEGRSPSPLFDTSYYLDQNPDIAKAGINPLVHYIQTGAGENKNPNPLFYTMYYLANNENVGESGLNPLAHFLTIGVQRGLKPNPLFDPSYYLSQNWDVRKLGINPLAHYLEIGAKEGCDPHPLFSSSYYLAQNPDLIPLSINPLAHYLEAGTKEGRDPHPLFDTFHYLEQCPDVESSGMTPLEHYLRIGAKEGRNPNPLFDSSYYLAHAHEAESSGMTPLEHYLLIGAKKGCDPNPLFDSSYYLDKNGDVDKEGVNPLLHYIQNGSSEYRDPNPLFDSVFYMDHNPDAAKEGMTTLEHYLTIGSKRKKPPSELFDTGFYLGQNPDVAETGINPLSHYLEFGISERRIPNPQLERFRFKPKISIITPVYNTEDRILHEMLDSVMRQIYTNWELCITDDGSTRWHVKEILSEYAAKDERIRIFFSDKTNGISAASNQAASHATGEYIGFLDHDDVLTMDALFEVVNAIDKEDPDFIYSDESLIEESGRYLDPIHKPNFSPDLLFSHNYITHLLIVKKHLFDGVGGFSSSCDGAQDYDLILKIIERTERIHHIPKVLYLWRKASTSTSFNPETKHYADDSGKRAIEAALRRREIDGTVLNANRPFFYRVKRRIVNGSQVAIIIPFRDQPEYLRRCIQSILKKSTYSKFEIIGISNGSQENETFDWMSKLKAADSRVKFFEYDIPFNYSKINNYGVSLTEAETILLLNNDVEIINSDWIESLLEHSQRQEVGAVSGKLYYPNHTIQHAGVILGIAGFAGHSHRHSQQDENGYANRLMCTQNVSAVSGALLMVKKRLYEEIGGLDEDHLSVALNDIDFCLRLREKGFLNIFTPYCEAIHHESVSRGYEDTPEQKIRFQREIRYFQKKWKEILTIGDPYYNPNLTTEAEDFSLKKKSRTTD